MRCNDAMPLDWQLAMTYYHGTKSIDNAIKIFQEGIVPSITTPEMISKTRRGCNMIPFENKVYLSSDLTYAIIYAIGGGLISVEIRSDEFKSSSEYFGFVFIVHGNKLKDVQPDEDDVARVLESLVRSVKGKDQAYNFDLSRVGWLYNLADKHLTARQFEKISRYIPDDSDLICVSKKLLRKMNDRQKQILIEVIGKKGGVAHEGVLFPDECYMIDKRDRVDLKPDGSNFFDIAVKVTDEDVIKLKESFKTL